MRIARAALLGGAVAAAAMCLAQDPDPVPPPIDAESAQEGPIEVGVTEETRVRLILVDVVVVDADGRTVSDLTLDDFQVVSRGRAAPVDTLDVSCPAGERDDPRVVRDPEKREPVPGPEEGRRVVLLFDYLHLLPLERELVLDQAMDLARGEALGGDEVMVAALTGGLRIEQRFTRDREELLDSLQRMRYDISLWNGNFEHLTEYGFVVGLTGLLDVLGTFPGRKSIVLFSSMGDVPLDSQFEEIAAAAAVSRCSLYPVDAAGLRPSGALGSTGGRFSPG